MEGKEKSKNVLIGVLVTVILVLAGLCVYLLFIKKDNDVVENSEQNNNEQSYIISDDEVKKELVVYKSNYGYLCVEDYCSEHPDSFKKSFTIKAKSENARLIQIDDTNSFILYDDDGIKIYNVKSGSIESTELEGNYRYYEMYLNEDGNKVIGIVYQYEDFRIGYYNVSLKKKLYDGKYTVSYWPMHLQVGEYLAISTEISNDDTAYLLGTKEEKIELSDNKSGTNYILYGTKGSNIIALVGAIDYGEIYKMYTADKKLFYNNSKGSYIFSYYNGFMYINDNNSVKKYDSNGNIILETKKYDSIKDITKNYIVYVNSGVLYLENIDNKDENKQLVSVEDNSYIWSSYYERSLLDDMDEKNKEEGLYVVVEYNQKDKNGYYGMEYCYTSDKKIIEYPITREIGGRAKPVLYLYPTIDTKVNVRFEYPEYLITTYPKYLNSWNVYAKTNGDLYDENGKYYYALYWDEKRYHEVDFSEGFYVDKENAINFLEEKLSIIGLNNRERNEFIMYWLPILEKNEKSLVYFELTEERENTNKLIISPKPDSLLRISIHIKKVNEQVNIKEQKLKTFNRVGFAAVEWGGMEY